MKRESDAIIVLLHDDKSTFKNKGRFPVQRFAHRWHNLVLSGYIEEVIPVEKADPSVQISNVIALYRPVVYMRGDDWPGFPGREAIECAEIPIRLVPYTKGISTTQIRETVQQK